MSEVQVGQVLLSSSSAYLVVQFIGEGCFGKVAKCLNLVTHEMVAVKILKMDPEFIMDAEKEIYMLELISVLDPDHANVTKFFERFEHQGHTCLVFEMLDTDLYDLIVYQDFKPLSLKEIRPIAQQLLVALDALKGLGILHTDIKPDNVMLVNRQHQPLRVKLIDFGTAIPASKVKPGLMCQPGGYRAPEVTLGLPFTEAIDVWGVGCVLAYLYLADNPFPVSCEYQMMKSMVELLGQPEDRLLRAGGYTHFFFREEQAADGPTWRLLTPEEFTAANSIKVQESDCFHKLPGSLDALVHFYPEGEAAEFEDKLAFVDLLKHLLHLDRDQRISPHQALQHPFITMSHLTEHAESRDYVSTSRTMMSICPNSDQESAAGSSGRDRHSVSSDEASAAGSSGSDRHSVSSDEASAAGSSGSDRHSVSSDEASAAGSVDGAKDCVSSDDDPTSTGSSDGVSAIYSDEESWRSHEGLQTTEDVPCSDGEVPSVSYEEDPADLSAVEAIITDSPAPASASSGRTRKLMKRIRRFFRRITAAFCCCGRAED